MVTTVCAAPTTAKLSKALTPPDHTARAATTEASKPAPKAATAWRDEPGRRPFPARPPHLRHRHGTTMLTRPGGRATTRAGAPPLR